MIFPDPPVPERDDIQVPPPPEGMAPSLASSIVHHLGVLERLERRVFGQIFSVYGLHPSQGIALKTIIRSPGMSQRELADRLRIQRATITVILQKLERGGFIRRAPDHFDQRIIRIFPTPLGEEASRLTDEACSDFFSSCFDGVPPEKQLELAALLDQCEENILNFEATLHSPKETCP